MTVGMSQEDFEREILNKGYEKDKQIESMGYQSFKNGNVYVAVNYDENSTVERIFINLLVDYNEWREVGFD